MPRGNRQLHYFFLQKERDGASAPLAASASTSLILPLKEAEIGKNHTALIRIIKPRIKTYKNLGKTVSYNFPRKNFAQAAQNPSLKYLRPALRAVSSYPQGAAEEGVALAVRRIRDAAGRENRRNPKEQWLLPQYRIASSSECVKYPFVVVFGLAEIGSYRGRKYF